MLAIVVSVGFVGLRSRFEGLAARIDIGVLGHREKREIGRVAASMGRGHGRSCWLCL